jgi:adenylylsulfate kinase
MSEPPSLPQIGRRDREQLLGQRAVVVWMTGLSGAGKSTLAHGLQARLHAEGRLSAVLDGDQVRAGLNAGLGFSEQDRGENIRRIAEVARILLDTGVIAIVAVISPSHAMRRHASAIIGEADFLEVFVSCPLEVCRTRDVKGLYSRAHAGQVPQFTGVGAPYEEPQSPQVVLRTDQLTVQAAVQVLAEAVAARL